VEPGPTRERPGRRPLAERGRYALWKAPERLTERQQATLSQIQRTNRPLSRAYLLKEQLRAVFHEPDTKSAIELLDAWIAWARRSRLASFVRLAATITKDRAAIVATLTHRLSNARMEAATTTIRLITRRAFGSHSAQALIALAMLGVGAG
jgi:transposase